MSKHLEIAFEMAEALDRVGGMDPITMREVKALCLPPKRSFTAEQIRRIREATNMSRAVFAACLNVGLSTVEQWEMGLKKPSGPAAKLLDVVERRGIEAIC